MSENSKNQEMEVKVTQGRFIMTQGENETEVMLITGGSAGGNKPPLGPPPVVPGAPEETKPEPTKPEIEAEPKEPEPIPETKPAQPEEAKPEDSDEPEPGKGGGLRFDEETGPEEEELEEPGPDETQEITIADHAKWFAYRALIWGVLAGLALVVVGGIIWAIMQNHKSDKHDATTPTPVLAQETPKTPVDLPPPPAKVSVKVETPTPAPACDCSAAKPCPPAPACDCSGKVAEALKSADTNCAKKLADAKVETPKATPVVKHRPRPRHISAEFYDEKGNLLRSEKIPRR